MQGFQTFWQLESGKEIRNKLTSGGKVWEVAARIVETKRHLTTDQRWEKRDGTWRLVEARALPNVTEWRLLPADPQTAGPQQNFHQSA